MMGRRQQEARWDLGSDAAGVHSSKSGREAKELAMVKEFQGTQDSIS